MSAMDYAGKRGCEEREVQVLGDEGRVMRKERGVEGVLDAGYVEAAVFGERMVALDEKREGRQGRQGKAHRPGRERLGWRWGWQYWVWPRN